MVYSPYVGSTVFGCRTLDQMKEDIHAAEQGPLDKDLLKKIDDIHLKYPNAAP